MGNKWNNDDSEKSPWKGEVIPDEDNDSIRSGLGGWLILVGIWVIAFPVNQLGYLNETYMPILIDSSMFSTPKDPLSASLFWGELILDTVIFFAAVYLVPCFFQKDKLFPKLFIWVTCSILAITLLKAMAIMFYRDFIYEDAMFAVVIQKLVFTMVWVPYILSSRRVKATFVH